MTLEALIFYNIRSIVYVAAYFLSFSQLDEMREILIAMAAEEPRCQHHDHFHDVAIPGSGILHEAGRRIHT